MLNEYLFNIVKVIYLGEIGREELQCLGAGLHSPSALN